MNTFKTSCTVLFLACLIFGGVSTSALASGTSASIVVSGNEGAIGVQAEATFEAYPTSDAGTLAVYRNNSYLGSKSGSGSASWSTVVNGGLLPHGDHTFAAVATDSKGVSSTATQTINIDNTPNLTLVVTKTEGDMGVHGTVDFKENTEGAEGDVQLWVYWNEGSYGYTYYGKKTYEGSNAINWEWEEIASDQIDLNTGTMRQGIHKIVVIATAANGDKIEKNYTFEVDNTPDLTLAVGKLEGDMGVHGTVDFKENTAGAEGDIQLWVYWNEGSYGYTYYGKKTYEGSDAISWKWDEIASNQIDLNTGIMRPGKHKIVVIATAANGAKIEKNYTFEVNNTPDLTLTVDKTEGDMGVHGTVDFKENTAGPEGDVQLWVYWNEGSYGYTYYGKKTYEGSDAINWKWDEIASNQIDLNTGTMRPGKHKIVVIATAANGDKIEKNYTFEVNNTPDLTLTVDKTEGDMGVHGTVDFKENTAGAEGDVQLWVYWNEGNYGYTYYGKKAYEGNDAISWKWDEIASNQIDLNTGTMRPGKHKIVVIATAANGDKIEKNYLFEVNNTPDLTLAVEKFEGDMGVHGTVDFKENTAGAEGDVQLWVYWNEGNYGYTYYGKKAYEGNDAISWKWDEIASNQIDLNTGTMRPGKHKIVVIATAANGDKIEKNYLFEVNNTPDLILAADKIEGDMGVHGTVDFKENTAGAEGDVQLWVYWNEGAYGYTYYGKKTYEGSDAISWKWDEIASNQIALNTGTMRQGIHKIVVIATAANGDKIEKNYTFEVDNTPKPAIDAPPVDFPDNTSEIVGTVLFKDNDDGNPSTADPEGTITLYISQEIKNPVFSQHGSTKSYEGTTINWKYSDFTNTRMSQSVWGGREFLVKIVATAANGATAEVIENPLIPPQGCPYPPANDCDGCQK